MSVCSSNPVYVVFNEPGNNWWKRFVDKRIGHCYLLVPDSGKWVVLNKDIDNIESFVVSDLSDIIKSSYIVKAYPKKSKRGLFMLNTCVGQVKQYLGIKNPFILTPYQLWRSLQ